MANELNKGNMSNNSRSKKKQKTNDPEFAFPVNTPSEKPEDTIAMIDNSNPEVEDEVLVDANILEETEKRNEDILENKIPFDLRKNIYLQLHMGNLYAIFSSGIIAPAKYIKDRAFADSQNLDESVLIMSNGIISALDESQVLLDINLTESEEKKLLTTNALALLNQPLPISRIKKIYLANEAVKKEIVQTALTVDGGIIPELLIQPSFPKELEQIYFTQAPNKIEKDYAADLKRYDRILGAFAYIKNYSWLLVNKTGELNILPQHFLYMANTISGLPAFKDYNDEKATSFYRKLFGLKSDTESPFLGWIFSRLNIDKNFTDKDIIAFGGSFLEAIQHSDFHAKAPRFLNDLTDSLKRKKVIKEIWQQQENEKSYLYLFSFLRNYGNLSAEDQSSARIDIPEIITTEASIGEYIFASLGYFYGYERLRNFEHNIVIDDKYIAEFVNLKRPLPLKFDLSTLLDYAIIESVYQAVFNDNLNSDDVQFLESEIIQNETVRTETNLPSQYTFQSTQILGKFNFVVKRKSDLDDAIHKLNKIPEVIPVVSELGVYLWRNGVTKTGINILELILNHDKLRFVFSFRRDDIIDALHNGKINPVELARRIDIGQQYKEF
jgi:hypothetical protein